ncbi:unnamed protein product [Rotaria socialis]|uniref:Tetraspanin n=1 Tax=Rotaria socialis TaxID=392032 RepID=A0A820UHT3_9BILA|nr:unnamed protein product [Rotaria socialis]CAF3358903.1 unnamed protein product [Rotaria socialis]CAF3423426.1 unnamed protein product [Rotaria socialis]CAF3494588.1 unnamed protein product [Rotaria socialis]CAF3517774.1 unnamed protein product [Rotaria socialis]
MGVATCSPCAKYLLLILNLFFWLIGLGLIALGLYFLLRPEIQNIIHLFNFTTLPLSSIEISACVLILFGVIIFLIGLFGFCGAQRESRTCLILYIILVTCVLLAQLTLFIFIAMHHEQGQSLVKQRLVSQIKKYNHMYAGQYEKAIDYVQSKYQCCGIDSAYDYSESHIPSSCCSTSMTSPCTVHQVGLLRTPGCYSLLTKTTLFWIKYIILIEFGLSALSLIGILLAICVCQNTMLYDGYTQTSYYI